MKNDKIYPEILSMVLISQVTESLKKDLQLSDEPYQLRYHNGYHR